MHEQLQTAVDASTTTADPSALKQPRDDVVTVYNGAVSDALARVIFTAWYAVLMCTMCQAAVVVCAEWCVAMYCAWVTEEMCANTAATVPAVWWMTVSVDAGSLGVDDTMLDDAKVLLRNTSDAATHSPLAVLL